MTQKTVVGCLLCVAIALFVVRCAADGVDAQRGKELLPEARELLPKVWIPDPSGAKRTNIGFEEWHDPLKDPFIPSFQMFKTVASWSLPERSGRDCLAVRMWDDDDARLIDEREFCERVARIVKHDMSRDDNAESVTAHLVEALKSSAFITNAITIHVRVDKQLAGGKWTELLSKRYLNVDGRFFYIGVQSDVGEQLSSAIRTKALREARMLEISNNLEVCAMRNGALLMAWEQEIRRCTWEHRLSEHGGDAEAVANAVSQELLADREKWKQSPRSLPPHERMERARRLMAERGYSSTNKPSREALDEILAEAGVIKSSGGGRLPSRTASAGVARPSRRSSSSLRMSPIFKTIFPIGLVLVLFGLPLFLGRRNSSGKGGGGALSDLQNRVDRCLLAGHIVTQRILKEWALIIQFFSPGEKPCRLCVPAVLFLWEKIFEPEMSHSEILELNERIKSACGLDKVFSKQNFKSMMADAIRENGYDAAWRIWRQSCDFAYSASERIGGSNELEVPSDFGASVYRLLKTWNGKFDGILLLPIDWKLFFKSHPELAEHEILVRFGVRSAEKRHESVGRVSGAKHQSKPTEEDGALSFLNAGKDGVVRAMLWQTQRKVVVDAISCRLYLPKGWNVKPEMRMVSPHDRSARVAGPGDHEWLSVAYLHLSPEHVHDDLGDWVNLSRVLFGKLLLNPPTSKASGVDDYTMVSFGRLNRRDTLFMKYHNADDMTAFAGTIEIEGRLHRLFLVIVRRGADSWKFEYVFPVADGVTKESQEFKSEEIASAARIFVPIETFGKVCCSFCGEKMDDPVDVADGKFEVWMKDFSLFDDMQLPKAAVGIPCCAACREKILAYGVSKARLEEIPAVHDQIARGASMLEVKCGKNPVSLLVLEKTDPQKVSETSSRPMDNDSAGDVKNLLRRIKAGDEDAFAKAVALRSEQLRKHPDKALKDQYARRKADLMARLQDAHQQFLEDYQHHGSDTPKRVAFAGGDGNFTMLVPKSVKSEANVERAGSRVQMIFEGDAPFEWIYVEHIGKLSADLRDGEEEMEDRIEFPLQIWDVLPIHSPVGVWTEGDDLPKGKLIGISRCMTDTAYMRHRNVDKMAAWVASHRFDDVVCRIFILALQRGDQGWLVEYVFPAMMSEKEQIAPGMTMWRVRPPTKEEADRLDNNISHADCDKAQMVLGSFAPDAMSESGEAENASDEEVEMLPVDENEIERAASEADAKCTFCGSLVSDDDTYGVDFDNYKMSDGSRDSVELLMPCCTDCRDKMLERGADMVPLRNNTQIREALSNGARFSEEWLAEQDRIKAEYRMKREMERR